MRGVRPERGPVGGDGTVAVVVVHLGVRHGITSIVFFLSILLHETGHALMAHRRGLEVRSVTLFGFGGVTEIDQEAKAPGDELRITIVGPLTSLLLGVVLLVGANLAGDTDDLWPGAIAYLVVINLTLGVFNLLPRFPLDGTTTTGCIPWSGTAPPSACSGSRASVP